MGMTTEDAARILGITKRQVVNLLRKGYLFGKMHGRDWDIDPDSVHQYAANRPKPGPRPGQHRIRSR